MSHLLRLQYATCRILDITGVRLLRSPLLWTKTCSLHDMHVQCMSAWTDKIRGRLQFGTDSSEQMNKGRPDDSNEVSASTKNSSKDTPMIDEKALKDFKELQMTLEQKEKELQEQRKEVEDFKDKFMRALAETENVRQRMKRQIEEIKLFGIQGFAKDILEVADILERATGSVPKQKLEENGNPDLVSLYEGLKLTEVELQKVLAKNGLSKIDTLGVVFDPNIHEAVFEIPGDEPGTIAVVSRVGYLLNGRTVRAAKVGVVKSSQS